MKTMRTAKVVLAMATTVLGLSACNGQDKKHLPPKMNAATLPVDSPKVDIRVNRKYDDKGNLIAYDSTYSSAYSTAKSDPALMDSLMRQFRAQLDSEHPFMNDPGFNDLFFQDSVPKSDFFYNDFFRKRLELNQRYMERMMNEMDSLKQSYFKDHQ